MSMIAEMTFVEDEINRIYPLIAQGEQSIMVQRDMKKWAVDNEMWPHMNYKNIVVQHAIARGWLQPYVDGMEIVE